MSKENGVVVMTHGLNIIKHIEKHTNKDIMNFKKIVIYVCRNNYYNVRYELLKLLDGTFKDCKYNKIITDKSQIYNRLQYIRQSGHQLENFATDGNVLEIEMM